MYLGVSLRAAELRQPAGVYRCVRPGCVTSADDSLTTIMLSAEAGRTSLVSVGVPDWSASGQIRISRPCECSILSALAGLLPVGHRAVLSGCPLPRVSRRSALRSDQRVRSSLNGHVALMISVCTLCRPATLPSLPPEATPSRCAATKYPPGISHQHQPCPLGSLYIACIITTS